MSFWERERKKDVEEVGQRERWKTKYKRDRETERQRDRQTAEKNRFSYLYEVICLVDCDLSLFLVKILAKLSFVSSSPSLLELRSDFFKSKFSGFEFELRSDPSREDSILIFLELALELDLSMLESNWSEV
jgi:hypothetical protein